MSQIELLLPKMGESVAEATIIKWVKKEGDKVTADEPIIEIATDKVDSEVPSPEDGILLKCLVKEGDVVAVGRHAGNSQKRLHVCRERQPNELGLYDMSGNVLEWCSDWYGPYRIDAFSQQNPKGPDSGELRVLRGGSWLLGAQYCRSAFRDWRRPVYGYYYFGFRLVLSPSSP